MFSSPASITNASDWTFTSCSWTASSTTSNSYAFYMESSPASIASLSQCKFISCSWTAITSSPGYSSFAFVMSYSPASIASSSQWTFTSCTGSARSFSVNSSSLAFYMVHSSINISNSSTFAFVLCSWTANTSSDSSISSAFRLDYSPATIANSSRWSFTSSNCTASTSSITSNSYAFLLYFSPATIANSSQWTFSLCNWTSLSNCSTSTAFDVASSPATISSSQWTFTSCTASATTYLTGYPSRAFFMYNSPATISSSSQWKFISCSWTAITSSTTYNSYAFYMESSPASIASSSQWTFTSCNFAGAVSGASLQFAVSFNFSPTLIAGRSSWQFSGCTFAGSFVLDGSSVLIVSVSSLLMSNNVFSGGGLSCVRQSSIALVTQSFWFVTENVIQSGSSDVSPITLDGTSSLTIGNASDAAPSEAMSWVIWASNNMSAGANDTCVQLLDSLAINRNGYMSVIENSCTSTRWMWRNSTGQGTVASGSGMLLVRCNLLNGALSTGDGVPPSAISAGACGTCNTTAECYAPLTVEHSTCGPKPGRKWGKAVCSCAPGGGGARCTPGSPKTSLSTSASESRTSSSSASVSAHTGSKSSTMSNRDRISATISASTSSSKSSDATVTKSEVNRSATCCPSVTATVPLTRSTHQKNTASSLSVSRSRSVDPCADLSYAKTTGDMVSGVAGSGFLAILTPLVALTTSAPVAASSTPPSSPAASPSTLVVLVVGCTYSELAASPATINVTLAANRLLKYGGLMAPLPRLIVDSPSPVEASVINESSFALTIAPVNYNKFTTVSIFATLPASAFHCEGKSAAITIEVLVSGAPLPVAINSAIAVARSASSLSVVSGTPAAAVASARVSMLQYLLSCQFNPKDVAYGNSLTGYLFGPKRGAPVRGAIVGNLFVFLLAVMLVVVICFVFAVYGAIQFGSGVSAGFGCMLNLFHFPSAVMMPAAAVLQPTVSAACTLLVYNPQMAPYDPQFAAWALIFIASYCCWVTYVLLFALVEENKAASPNRSTSLWCG